MSLLKKILLIILVSTFLFAPLGAFSTVYSQSVPQNIETVSLAFLTQVYPLNFIHYNITLNHIVTMDSNPIPTYSVGYFLNSPDSNLAAGFLFKDGTLYSASLSVINGSVVTDRPYANLTDQARDFLVKYQAFSGADSKDLIQMLDQFDEAGLADTLTTVYSKSPPITLGNISFSVSHFQVPTTETLSTGYTWLYSLNDADDVVVEVSFANNTFSGFSDSRQFYLGSKEAINIAADYAVTVTTQGQINNADIDRSSSIAEFRPKSQNGTVKPYWHVSLELNSNYSGDVSTLQMDVWANTGKVFNFNSTKVVSVQVNNLDRLLIQGGEIVFLGVAVGGLLVGLVATIAMWRRRKNC